MDADAVLKVGGSKMESVSDVNREFTKFLCGRRAGGGSRYDWSESALIWAAESSVNVSWISALSLTLGVASHSTPLYRRVDRRFCTWFGVMLILILFL